MTGVIIANEAALKTYRELAHKEPDIYLRYVAITLNNLGILEGAQNYLEEALKIYRELAQKERETYLPYVATTLNNLGILDSRLIAQIQRLKTERNEIAQKLSKNFQRCEQAAPPASQTTIYSIRDRMVQFAV